MTKKMIINFKAYSEATGPDAEKLADKFSSIDAGPEGEIVIAPDLLDTLRVKDTDIKVYGQHVDPVDPGSHTGSVTVEALKQAQASGTLINHSEKRMDDTEIKEALNLCKDAGLETVICAQTVEEVKMYSRLEPDYIAFEPPELIGGDNPVSEAEPEVVRKAVENTYRGVETLTGAGIKSKKDVEKSLELGCDGVLVASGVLKTKKPVERVKNLCEGF